MRSRPDWDAYFLSMAMLASARSHDSESQHGCVIVNRNDLTIVGVGYNGFPRGLDDENWPDTRESGKYNIITSSNHAESNALANCSYKPIRCAAYITGYPCNECMFNMYNHGISIVLHAGLWKPTNGKFATKELLEIREKFLEAVNMKFNIIQASTEIVDAALNLLTERALHFTNKKKEVLANNGI